MAYKFDGLMTDSVNVFEERAHESDRPLTHGQTAARGRFCAQAFLGTALAGLRRYAEAEPLLLSGYAGMRQGLSRMPAKEKKWVRRSSREQIVDLYSRWHKPGAAAQ
jgi:hypothetical protein